MNMSYCRFRNTLQDLNECYSAMVDPYDEDGETELSRDEARAKEELLLLCSRIVEDFEEEIEELL